MSYYLYQSSEKIEQIFVKVMLNDSSVEKHGLSLDVMELTYKICKISPYTCQGKMVVYTYNLNYGNTRSGLKFWVGDRVCVCVGCRCNGWSWGFNYLPLNTSSITYLHLETPNFKPSNIQVYKIITNFQKLQIIVYVCDYQLLVSQYKCQEVMERKIELSGMM